MPGVAAIELVVTWGLSTNVSSGLAGFPWASTFTRYSVEWLVPPPGYRSGCSTDQVERAVEPPLADESSVWCDGELQQGQKEPSSAPVKRSSSSHSTFSALRSLHRSHPSRRWRRSIQTELLAALAGERHEVPLPARGIPVCVDATNPTPSSAAAGHHERAERGGQAGFVMSMNWIRIGTSLAPGFERALPVTS